MFRFAELKLLYAEALLAKGRAAEATTEINDIRDRAGLADLAGTATMADLQTRKGLNFALKATAGLTFPLGIGARYLSGLG